MKSRIQALQAPRDFIAALRNANVKPAVLTEIKKASPSKGEIREDFDSVEIVGENLEGGASCLFVRTEKNFFQGGFDGLANKDKFNFLLFARTLSLLPNSCIRPGSLELMRRSMIENKN